MSEVDVKYRKENGAREVTVTIRSNEPLTMLDVLRALSSVISGILNTGKY